MNMMLLGEVLFGDKDALVTFMGEHEFSHNGINQAVIDQFNIVPFDVPIGNLSENKDLLLNHYKIHQNLSTILGLTGLPDLSDVDMTDESQFYDWMESHNLEHAKINAVLGLL